MSTKLTVFDSYVLHIEQKTLDRLNEVRELIIKNSHRYYDFDRIVYLSLGKQLTALKYQAKIKGNNQ